MIGADGANSLVRRRVATPFRRDQLSIATGFFAHGVTSDEIVIELTSDPPGYIWSFPRPTHLAIGICAQADAGVTAEALRARTARWIAATRIADGARLEPYAWPIPSLSASDFDAVALAGPRWALAGDAAGLVDPITREGIYFALASGQWIADALAAGDDARVYASRVRDEAVSELARAARLKAGFFRPAFTGLMIRALQQSPAIRAVMADLVAGRQPYASLKWRLLRTLEWRLALSALARSALKAVTRRLPALDDCRLPALPAADLYRLKYPSRARTRRSGRLTVTSMACHAGSVDTPRAGTYPSRYWNRSSRAIVSIVDTSSRGSRAWNDRPPVAAASSANSGGRDDPIATG